MTGCINDLYFRVFPRKNSFLGVDGDPMVPFLFVIVQVCVAMVYPSHLPDRSGAVEHSLYTCCLSGIDMCQDPDHCAFHAHNHIIQFTDLH